MWPSCFLILHRCVFYTQTTLKLDIMKGFKINMTVRDIWGKIEVERDFELILNCKEYGDLRNKTQLGLNTNANANHTRYQHSLGVYFLVCKLIDICKKKFEGRLVITEDDEKALKVMALVHDIGHGCFSHVSERTLDGTHEERTVNILKDENTEIHRVLTSPPFGQKILDKVLELIQMKEKLKNKEGLDATNNLMLIIRKLLSGGIDIDRIDYIFRDSANVLGENNDFSGILDSIDLEYVEDSLEVVFDERAEYAIANFFNKRFELYDTVYCSTPTRILESIFDKLIEMTGFELTWNTSEVEMNNFFRECENDTNEIARRYARFLSTRSIDTDIIHKEINDFSSFEFEKNKILNAVPELKSHPNCIFVDSVNINIYNQKNKVFIKKGGLIRDIKECSRILNSDLRKEKHIFAVDLVALEHSLKRAGKTKEEIASIIKRIKKAMSPEIEQEKKYTFNEKSTDPKTDFAEIKRCLNLGSCKLIENDDVYYDKDGVLQELHINLRRREKENETEWTLKRPVKDSSSISKRNEKNFSSKEEALAFLRSEWGLIIDDVEEEITLKTKRAKYTLECFGGVFELVFDKTVPYVDGVAYPSFYMIECELKSGNSSGLYFINQKIKSFDFIDECNQSKKEIAEEIVSTLAPVGQSLILQQKDQLSS
ncbi:MAG TPA: hypothetical protein DCY94_05335 [Firmicutes bacterium]|nr:hypothetical protein [Bacillota bacterium]